MKHFKGDLWNADAATITSAVRVITDDDSAVASRITSGLYVGVRTRGRYVMIDCDRIRRVVFNATR